MLKNNVMMVVNPVSGGLDKGYLVDQVSHYAQQLNLNLMCFETTGVNDLDNIRTYYKKFNPARVLIAGGDGTIKIVAEALKLEDVIFGILPVGSSNGLATDLGLVKSSEENIAIAFQNHFVAIDCIIINGKMCLHLSDLGLNAELIKNYHKSAIRGKLGYALQIFNTLLHAEKSFQVIVKTNQQLVETKARMIVIANSQKYGTGVVINPIGIMSDGKFELIILKKLDFSVFFKIIMGKITVSSGDITVISTDNAMISIDKPISFQIDGEYCGTETNLDIAMSKRKLKVAMLKV
ncbi:diacylglycerol/lipid kinase family protein [Flavobacterium commune]|uniref:Diacylglycerol kinase n=1 Tax=Flavobacterium commune TaxID=1306519 RepID=A0A1D9PBN5_9FLAO|nr:diacylglycerol kinase family protein [Flavobacterium commune]AOZ99744.1 diacylglycerol kinase [Flavobacterium commune]